MTVLAAAAAGVEEGVKVYISKSATVYHLYRDCTYLAIKLTRVKCVELSSYRNASGGKYYPCTVCAKGTYGDGDYMYISKYGECYHADEKCRNIYHNIIETDKENAGNRDLCSKCRDRKSVCQGKE